MDISNSHLNEKIEALEPELIQLRRTLHRHPELGFEEHWTAGVVAEYLKALGLEVTTGVGGTGVIGLLRGEKEGRTIALRACLDALAIQEQSGVPYASENPGIMHACGHDGNMIFVLGAAKALSLLKPQLSGNVKFIFQPSEENTGGAERIILEGGLNEPAVNAIVTLHNWHGVKQGLFAAVPGPLLASSDLFQLKIMGTPGHGAWPHLAVDPVVIAADVIRALQSIVSREVDPLKPAAVTIGKISGGTAVNIIPDHILLEGTVRTFDEKVRSFIQTRINDIADGITKAARGSYELIYSHIMPPVDNERALTAFAAETLSSVFGSQWVTADFPPAMGCEEFSLFQEQIPGLFLIIGNDKEGMDAVPIHSPHYIFPDENLVPGVKALCGLTLRYLDKTE